MSDDTPTQRFPEQGDAPTERIATGEVYEELGEERQKSRGLLVGLIIAGALLIAAIVVILIIFLGRGSGAPQADPTSTPSDSSTPAASDTPQASDTPTPTPEPSETQAPPPPPPPPSTALAIDTWKANRSTVSCKSGNEDVNIKFTWATSNGSQVFFGVATNDASQAPFFDNLPSDGNSNDDFPDGYRPFQYVCGNSSQKYTLTVIDNNGNKQSKTITITATN